jgi:hypothetical protein
MPITRYHRIRHVRSFLLDQFSSEPVSFRDIQCNDVVRFLRRHTLHWDMQSNPVVHGALRSYFRFKALQGEPTATC